jgi:hypothetical protein
MVFTECLLVSLGLGLDVRPEMPIRSRRAEVCTDAAIFC